jgi:hypothetical protein
MAFTSTLLTNVPSPIFTSITGSSVITCVYLCNIGSQPTNFCVFAVPNGQTVSMSRAIYYNVSLTANDTYVMDTEKLMLSPGDALFANLILPSANPAVNVVVTVSSIEV